MPRVIVLNTFPLSNMARREVETARTVGEQCQQWVTNCLAAGNRVVAPSICYYDEYVVATTNVGHLAQFVSAELWTNIAPGS